MKGREMIERMFYVAVAVAIAVIVTVVAGDDIRSAWDRASARAERAEYEQRHPCINGIRYIRSGYDAGTNLTPMIDPTTMQPQLCGLEVGK